MRRKTLLVCLLFFICLGLQARVSITPNFSITNGAAFTKKPDETILRTSYALKAELDPLCMSINGNHFLSIPLSYSYTSRTPYWRGYCLNSHMDFGLGLGYRYRFNDNFSFETSVEAGFRYIHEVHGGIWALYVTAEPWIHINEYLAVTVPVKLGITKAEFSIAPAIGITYLPCGGGR